MEIRKSFKFNGMHIVRNCSSERCKKSLHAHEYKVEVLFESDSLDNGMMVLDFGLMKGNIKDIIMSFNNSYSLWNKECNDFKDLIYSTQKRVVEMPVSPSAESYAIMFYYLIKKLLKCTEFNNGENVIKVSKVIVHETRTGYAQATSSDLSLVNYKLEDIKFNQAIQDSWTLNNLISGISDYEEGIVETKPFVMPVVEQQII